MNSNFGTLVLGAALLLVMAKLGMVGEAIKVVSGVHDEVAPAEQAEQVGSTDPTADDYNPSLEAGYIVRCEDAVAMGLAPLTIGQEGYRPELDPDKDGIACDK